jgi:hypothetical protein
LLRQLQQSSITLPKKKSSRSFVVARLPTLPVMEYPSLITHHRALCCSRVLPMEKPRGLPRKKSQVLASRLISLPISRLAPLQRIRPAFRLTKLSILLVAFS